MIAASKVQGLKYQYQEGVESVYARKERKRKDLSLEKEHVEIDNRDGD